jgi:hypothetical protein
VLPLVVPPLRTNEPAAPDPEAPTTTDTAPLTPFALLPLWMTKWPLGTPGPVVAPDRITIVPPDPLVLAPATTLTAPALPPTAVPLAIRT